MKRSSSPARAFAFAAALLFTGFAVRDEEPPERGGQRGDRPPQGAPPADVPPPGAAGSPPATSAEGEEPVDAGFLGDPLPDVSPAEFERFRLGLDDFLEVEAADEGLGPGFNGLSCAQCHAIPRIGGSGLIAEVRAGTRRSDGSFVEPAGGSLLHLFTLPPHELRPALPPGANVVALRRALPIFGDGLVEAVPDAALLALADPEDRDRDGVSGRAALVIDQASGQQRVGRFGWKAQQATLLVFGAEAYRNEMGITNDLFAAELCSPGLDCAALALADAVGDPEDVRDRSTGLRGIDNFESFMLFLGPPPRAAIDAEAERGEGLFQAAGCARCHTPSLTTGDHPSSALARKQFFPFGDFLLHDIGTGDGIGQADAAPGEIRTTPLWGVRFRAPFLHDGRAATLSDAIGAHHGEAESSRAAFQALGGEDRGALLAFLRSL